MAASPSEIPPKISGSVGLTLSRKLLITRVPAKDASSPMPSPIATSRRPRRGHRRYHAARRRANGHADADLARPLRDRVRDDAVDAQHRQQQPGDAEDCGDDRRQALRKEGDGNEVVVGHRAHERHCRIERTQLIAYHGSDVRPIGTREHRDLPDFESAASDSYIIGRGDSFSERTLVSAATPTIVNGRSALRPV